MPIREIRADDLDQECSKCGRVVAVPFTAIAAGATGARRRVDLSDLITAAAPKE